MGIRTVLIMASVGSILIAINLTGAKAKKISLAKSSLPVQAVREEENEILLDSIDAAVDEGRDADLKDLFRVEHLSSATKAYLIDAAMEAESGDLNQEARHLLRQMVERGSLSDVLAVLPEASNFNEDIAREIAGLQESLCRFSLEEDGLGFEQVKLKFDLVFKNQADIKPWPAVCRKG